MCGCGKHAEDKLQILQLKKELLSYRYKNTLLRKQALKGGNSKWYYSDDGKKKYLDKDTIDIINNIYTYLKTFKDEDIVKG